MADPLRYRAHHFLCSLGFQGKGYSEVFTANMTAIVMGRLRTPAGDATEIDKIRPRQIAAVAQIGDGIDVDGEFGGHDARSFHSEAASSMEIG